MSIATHLEHVKPGETIVEIDRVYFRPTEVESLIGNSEKARKELGWQPEIKFHELVVEMIQEDLEIAERDKTLQRNGQPIRKNMET